MSGKTAPQHHRPSTILNSGDQVIFGIGILIFMPNISVALSEPQVFTFMVK